MNATSEQPGRLVEAIIAASTDVLGVPVTGDSDFLALGGTSLAAVAIVQAICDRYGEPGDGFELAALKALFEQATLNDMAICLCQAFPHLD